MCPREVLLTMRRAIDKGEDPDKAIAALEKSAASAMSSYVSAPTNKGKNKISQPTTPDPGFKRKWADLSSSSAMDGAPVKKGKLPQLAIRRRYPGNHFNADGDADEDDDEDDVPLLQRKMKREAAEAEQRR